MKRILQAVVWIACLAAAGCMRLGPAYQRPDAGFRIPGSYLAAEKEVDRPYAPEENWWTRFRDPELNRVVAQVIRNNPDIQQAAAAVLESRSLLRQTQAGQYPTLNLNGRAVRQQQSAVEPFSGEERTLRTDSFSFTLPASCEIDLWGRLARASEAARADLLAARENRKTIIQSLVAEAVSQYFQIRSLEARLAITRQLTKTYEANRELVEGRYQQGLTSILDVRQARRGLAQSEAEIPSILQAIGKARQFLAVLQGQYPGHEAPPEEKSLSWELPPPIPAGLPSGLLNSRPDIRAAEASLQAACARIGAAKANRFPQITLTGSFGYSSDELSALFEPENELWQIATGIFQPLFDAGKRKAAQNAAEARYERQMAIYAQTVLEAFAEVEGALLTRRQQMERYKRLKDYLTEAEKTLDTALDRYQRGLTSYLNVLDAQKALFQAELGLVETRNAIYTNRVGLYRALGGGWGRQVLGDG